MSVSRRRCGRRVAELADRRTVARDVTRSSVRSQFGQQLLRGHEPRLALRRAVDLAVDAIEVADLVRIQIDADRNAARPPAQHRVDEPVVVELAARVACEVGQSSCAAASAGPIDVACRVVNSSMVTVVSSPSSRRSTSVSR